MKNVLFALMAIIVLGSCDKLDELTKFDIEYQSNVTIESTVGIDVPFDVYTPDVETNSESKFEVNDTRKDLIEEIRLKELVLNITSPDDTDFSFLESIVIYISAEGLDEIKIAEEVEVDPNTGNSLDVDVVDVDLKEYIKKDEFKLHLETVTDEVISRDHEIEVNSTFFVDAKFWDSRAPLDYSL